MTRSHALPTQTVARWNASSTSIPTSTSGDPGGVQTRRWHIDWNAEKLAKTVNPRFTKHHCMAVAREIGISFRLVREPAEMITRAEFDALTRRVEAIEKILDD